VEGPRRGGGSEGALKASWGCVDLGEQCLISVTCPLVLKSIPPGGGWRGEEEDGKRRREG
jgi:hypothetical protein